MPVLICNEKQDRLYMAIIISKYIYARVKIIFFLFKDAFSLTKCVMLFSSSMQNPIFDLFQVLRTQVHVLWSYTCSSSLEENEW